jgi:transposase
MFIRKVTKSNKGSSKKYDEYRLVKSYRIGDKVSQRVILVMKDIRLPKKQWQELANAIEAMIQGQKVLFIDRAVEDEATRWFNVYLTASSKQAVLVQSKATADFEEISLSSVSNHQPKTIGAEHIALSMYRELGFDKMFRELDFNQKQRNDAALSILGRMLEPGSEHATAIWSRSQTGLDELLGTDFSKLSHNSLYRITDQIYRHKEFLEEELRKTECSIFNLEESIFLYDLTNTYMEGMAPGIDKASFGRSKEKRTDCRLLTLGLVIDDQGFPKRTKVLEGSVSEPKTLQQMIEYLSVDNDTKPVTVIIDAGISSEDNLKYLRKHGYHYICVARNKAVKPEQIDETQFVAVPNKGNNEIQTQIFKTEDESILYCKSTKMGEKEAAMQEKFCSRFETELNKINVTLASKRGRRKFEYIQERVIRLKERFKSVSSFYTINIEHEDDKAIHISYVCDRQDDLENKYSGSYCLRTSHLDLSNEKIWSLYMLLNTVESAFRTLKSDLNFRPVYHQKELRAEAHLFIAVLAYHIVNAIRHRLSESEITLSWSSLRRMMRNHQLILTSMQSKDGKTITILDTSVPEESHKQIYKALNLSPSPIKRKTVKRQLV